MVQFLASKDGSDFTYVWGKDDDNSFLKLEEVCLLAPGTITEQVSSTGRNTAFHLLPSAFEAAKLYLGF